MPSGTTTLILALGATALLIAAALLAAASATGSAALFAMAIHAVLLANWLGLIANGTARARRLAAAGHAERASREQLFWSELAAIPLFALGAGIAMSKGIAALFAQTPILDPATGISAMALTGLVWWMVGLLASGATAPAGARFSMLLGADGRDSDARTADDAAWTVALAALRRQDLAFRFAMAFAVGGLALAFSGALPRADALAAILIGLQMGVVAGRAAIAVRHAMARD